MTRSTIRMLVAVGLGQAALATGALAAGTFDGVYTGTQRETISNNGGMCRDLTRDNIHITIMANVIKYQWGKLPLEATVENDGSFSADRPGLQTRGASAIVSLKGRISGGNLEADVGGSACAAHLSLKKT